MNIVPKSLVNNESNDYSDHNYFSEGITSNNQNEDEDSTKSRLINIYN